MSVPFPDVLYPIFAALCYTLGVIIIKYSSQNNALSGSSLLVMNNLVSGLVFIPQIFFANALPELNIVWQPLLAGAFCAVGNIATFFCAERGEVSLMTPIMGVKILFVLMFSALLLRTHLPLSIIIAGALCCISVFIMSWTKQNGEKSKLIFTIFLALLASTAYAICDVILQKTAHNFDTPAMLSIMTLPIFLSIIPFIPKFFKEAYSTSKNAISLGVLSAIFLVGESYLMFISITGKVGAALCNILFNTRGVIAIILVYILGKQFAKIKELNKSQAIRRIVGAGLILISIFIALYC